MSSSSPKVFGVGDATICVNQEGMRLYVGHQEIEYIKSFELKIEPNKPRSIIISFFSSHDKELSRLIEQSVRTARQFSWINIVP